MSSNASRHRRRRRDSIRPTKRKMWVNKYLNVANYGLFRCWAAELPRRCEDVSRRAPVTRLPWRLSTFQPIDKRRCIIFKNCSIIRGCTDGSYSGIRVCANWSIVGTPFLFLWLWNFPFGGFRLATVICLVYCNCGVSCGQLLFLLRYCLILIILLTAGWSETAVRRNHLRSSNPAPTSRTSLNK